MKKTYQNPEVEVTEFKIEDVITTSGGDNDLPNPWSKSTSYWNAN